MKKILKYGFVLIMVFTLFGCYRIDNEKFLEFENGDFAAKITIIDKNGNQIEYDIKPEWSYGWSEKLIGDFNFVNIKTENNVEGKFIINNKYRKKLLPFDIISKNDFDMKIIEKYENNRETISYKIIIKIVEDKFEIEYDDEKFDISSSFNYKL